MSRGRAIRQHLAAVTLFAVVVLVNTWPMARTFTRAVPSYPSLYLTMAGLPAPAMNENVLNWDMDIGIAVWVYAWDVHQTLRDPLHLFDANIYRPEKNTLAMIDNYFGIAMMGAPAWLLTHNPAVMYNSILFLAYVLTGWAVFGYMRHRTGSFPGALAAGLAAVVLPFHYAHMHTIHKTMFLSIPLTLWALERFAATRRFRYGLGFILAVAWQLTCTWYLTVLLAVVMLFFFLHLILFHRRILLTRNLIPVAAAALLILLPLTWFFARPYLTVRRMFPSFNRSVESQHSVSPMMYLTAGDNNRMYGEWFPGIVRVDKPLRTYFPGFALYGLGLLGMILFIRRPALRKSDITGTGWFLMVFGILSAAIALGPFLKLAHGRIPLPFYFLYHALPVMKALRGPQDFVLVFYFMLMFFTAYAVQWLWDIKGSAGKAAGILLLLFLGVEGLHRPFPVVPLPSGKAVPACYRWAGEQPGKPMVATYYPRMKDGRLRFWSLKHFAMYYSIFHFCPIPDGHSAYVPPLARHYRRITRHFPQPETLAFSRKLGVRYILLDLRGHDPALARAVRNALDGIPALTEERSFDDSLVYALH